MSIRRIIVAGTGSGVGKTTVAIGLMAAYKELGYQVQGFKCGPDYIDPTYQTAVTGRISRNLDSWMCEASVMKEIFVRGGQGADIAIIEGVMGLFDGKDPLSDVGSAAEIAKITNSPVLLVVDCGGTARSAAAIVKGFQTFSKDVRLCGIVANRVGSEGHFQLIRQAVEAECGIPVVGYLLQDTQLIMPERHLGLIPSIERGELQPLFELLSDTIQQSFDLALLYHIMGSEVIDCPNILFQTPKSKSKVRIAIAKDEAFHFYYQENLELLEYYGAELVFFSPLQGEKIPSEIHGLYIGGGFPEEFAGVLSAQKEVLRSVEQAIQDGIPTLAECGGFMFLSESIETIGGDVYPMVGIVPGRVKMMSKLAAIGYREVTGTSNNFLIRPNDHVRGHEFHYSTFIPSEELTPSYVSSGRQGTKEEGFAKNNLVAGYTHIHFGSSPKTAKRWVEQCESYKKNS
ncbi:cobyrinate a,c-diamide synthase [Fredinandcohnia quinoae]|uniref:Cobyrinate a,c-diamide synthase n=1 Tax=Fredinandcohnia quinoae TaxID=2918902 RepID=A0AAW5DX90_9BACI|nr:cobyrinate a,c-diamide synthase [Fredinandcohnia sp. SECRCQ15]MCH1625277.1 cobyrinate a,c-diamide synthase [Fredinandcohnia sp. SECRCQ15]